MKLLTPVFLAVLAATPALASPSEKSAATVIGASGQNLGISAVVGADAISSYDVENRMKFIIVTARLSNTPDVIERIRPTVFRSLIDEHLEMQEAAKNDITISQDDVDQAIAGIESQRGMPPGTIFHMLASSNVPKETFTQQIRAQLLWNKLLMKKIRPTVHVSDAEIKLASSNVPPAPTHKNGPQELKIAVLTLPVDKPSRDTEIKRLAEKLVGELHHGANFEEVARQFSSTGGKVEAFWIKPEQLEANTARALVNAGAGTISDPVRSSEGYTIIKVYDTRAIGGAKAKPEEDEAPKDNEVYLKEILLKAKPDTGDKEADAMLEIGNEVAKHPGTCDEQTVAGIKDLDDAAIDVQFQRTAVSDLPPAIKVIVDNLKVGEISTPFASYEGIRLYMLCEKKEVAAKPVDRERVYGMLIQKKMELEAQKYIRNLRRETYIDVR